MPRAYVLINTDPDVEEEFMQEVRRINGVVSAASVYGIYDFIIIVEAQTMEIVKGIITSRIRRLRNVKATITLVEVDS